MTWLLSTTKLQLESLNKNNSTVNFYEYIPNNSILIVIIWNLLNDPIGL